MDLLPQIEQEIQPYALEVRKITVSGAHFWSFEASWRSSEAVNASHTLHMDSNQVDLSGKLLDLVGF